MNRIVTIGYVWKSQQNGAVYDVGGVAPAITTCFFYNILEVIYEQQETGDASPE